MVHYSRKLDTGFSALSDPTRRGILEQVGRSEGTIGELAERFGMTLTGMKKHVQVLEHAGLLSTRKEGRVRYCTIGPRKLDDEMKWMEKYREMLEGRFDRLGQFLDKTKEER